MPLLDHFRPPLSVSHPWKGFHSAWANAITNHLNEVLPEGYYAIPEVPLGDQIEIDLASLELPGNGTASGAATADGRGGFCTSARGGGSHLSGFRRAATAGRRRAC